MVGGGGGGGGGDVWDESVCGMGRGGGSGVGEPVT